MPETLATSAPPSAPTRDGLQLDPGTDSGSIWDKFNPHWYVAHNYSTFRDDDRRILQLVRDYFQSVADPTVPGLDGIDVGSGANLYPALSMLPFCNTVTLWERGRNNVNWLNDEVQGYAPLWENYWHTLASRAAYRAVEKPRDELRSKARVHRGDLFKLPQRRWDLGTMFFVAESISEQERVFKAAIERFIGSLRPGAPFAAAFMRDSSGYYVDRLRFPAVAVSEADVEHCLAPLVDSLEIKPVRSEVALRDGYHGMIVALGKVGKARS